MILQKKAKNIEKLIMTAV